MKEGLTKVDLRDYSLPTSDLIQGRVYCYVDSIGAYKRFEYDRATISGTDTFLETTQYDSCFVAQGQEKDRVTKTGCMPLDLVVFQHGVSYPAQLNQDLIPWIHSLGSGESSVHMRFLLRFEGGQAMNIMDGSFDSVIDKSLLGAYREQDCIQESSIGRMDVGASPNTVHIVTRDVYCLCKGIGKIGSIESDGRRQFLKRIISKDEFDAMKGQH